MIDPRVEGAQQLERVAKALRDAPPALKRELARSTAVATQPLKDEAVANLPRMLPRRGGLAAASSRDITVATQRRGGGMRIRARSRKSRSNLRLLDQGAVRHPLFGNRDYWFTTRFEPGWFSKPMQAGADKLRRELTAAIGRVADKIAKDAQ